MEGGASFNYASHTFIQVAQLVAFEWGYFGILPNLLKSTYITI